MSAVDFVVIHEHPEWQKPLFAGARPAWLALEALRPEAGCILAGGDSGGEALTSTRPVPAHICGGNTRAVPLALAYLRWLEAAGRRVLNGSVPFSLELSKSAQAALLRRLDVPTPRCIVFKRRRCPVCAARRMELAVHPQA